MTSNPIKKAALPASPEEPSAHRERAEVIERLYRDVSELRKDPKFLSAAMLYPRIKSLVGIVEDLIWLIDQGGCKKADDA